MAEEPASILPLTKSSLLSLLLKRTPIPAEVMLPETETVLSCEVSAPFAPNLMAGRFANCVTLPSMTTKLSLAPVLKTMVALAEVALVETLPLTVTILLMVSVAEMWIPASFVDCTLPLTMMLFPVAKPDKLIL